MYLLQEGILAGRTTSFARTIATLQGILTGLYPGTLAEVPITTANDKEEILYGNVRACERLGVLFKAKTAMLKGQPALACMVNSAPCRDQPLPARSL